jgi:hypothetical protein
VNLAERQRERGAGEPRHQAWRRRTSQPRGAARGW